MVAFKFVSAVALASLAVAAPTGQSLEKRANIDSTVLQFALTLEHLEKVFYKQALQNYTLAEFEAAGYSADYYNNLKYIAFDEQEHVNLLKGALKALGQRPVANCVYKFPSTDVPSFITLSSVLEGVGTSAYLGAAGLITSKDYLTVAGSILAVEALHTSAQRLAVGGVPMANALETPLDPNSVFTLALSFIVSCPDSNVALPFKAFPALAYNGDTCTCEQPDCRSPDAFVKRAEGSYTCTPPSEGDTVRFTAARNIPAGSHVTFVNGLTVTSVPGRISGARISAAIPAAGIAGQTYVFITDCDMETTFRGSRVLYGPAIVEVKPAAPVLTYKFPKE